VENGGCFSVKKVDNGVCFLLKKWKIGFFVKKVDLSSKQGALCTLSVFFNFTFYLFGGVCTHLTHPPAYGPVTEPQKSTIRILRIFLNSRILLNLKNAN